MIEIRYSNELPIKSSDEIISAIMTDIEYKKYRVGDLPDVFTEEGVIDIGYAWTTWTDGDPILFIYNFKIEDPRCIGKDYKKIIIRELDIEVEPMDSDCLSNYI